MTDRSAPANWADDRTTAPGSRAPAGSAAATSPPPPPHHGCRRLPRPALPRPPRRRRSFRWRSRRPGRPPARRPPPACARPLDGRPGHPVPGPQHGYAWAVPITTGNPAADAADDFNRARRQHVVRRLASRLRGAPADIDVILPFDEVVVALGQRGLRDLGLRMVDLDTVVGTVDRTRDFDRWFRPTTNRPRQRFERLAAAIRRGEPIEPIDVYRVGEAHFVRDGHHRVAVARALGIPSLEAHVVEVLTAAGAGRDLRLHDLPLKSSERLFAERVPLPPEGRRRVRLDDPDDY